MQEQILRDSVNNLFNNYSFGNWGIWHWSDDFKKYILKTFLNDYQISLKIDFEINELDVVIYSLNYNDEKQLTTTDFDLVIKFLNETL